MNSERGISPVVASIIIILVAVSLAGTYTLWANQLFGGVQEEGEGEIGRTTQALTSSLSISSASGQQLFIKNTGSSELSASAVEIFVDDEPVDFTADFNTLEQDELGSLTLQEVWSVGAGSHDLRVTAGGFSDSTDLRVDPHRSVVGFWRFEGGTGEIAEDSSSNENTGTLKDADTGNSDGETLPQWVDGRVGTALDFDGVDDMVSVPDNFDLDTLTYSFWVNPAAAQGDDSRIVSQASGPALTFIRQTDGAVVFRVRNSGTNYEISSDPLETEEWSHVVATFSNGEQNIYVNGNLEGTETRSFTELDSGSDMSIASHNPSGSFFLDGRVDEVAILSRALQPNQLYTLSISG